MREDTKKRLERAIWMERAKKAGIGAAIVGAIALVFAYQSYDLKVTNVQTGGSVTEIDPLVSKTSAADGETVRVKLDDGHTVAVLALKSRHIKLGDHLDVTAHHHATGRVTYTLK
ncbi:MAG: hypothetical protein ABL897_03905 [Hyphomicrobium sp.]